MQIKLDPDGLKAAVEAHMAEFQVAREKPQSEEEAAEVMLRAQAKAIIAYLTVVNK